MLDEVATEAELTAREGERLGVPEGSSVATEDVAARAAPPVRANCVELPAAGASSDICVCVAEGEFALS